MARKELKSTPCNTHGTTTVVRGQTACLRISTPTLRAAIRWPARASQLRFGMLWSNCQPGHRDSDP
eukprot:9071506-Lingulodinium_polyedra.AAC.1